MERPDAVPDLELQVDERAGRKVGTRGSWRVVGFYLLVVLVALPLVFPVWWMFTSSLKEAADVFVFPPTFWPEDPQWSNYLDVFKLGPFHIQMWNSIYIAVLNVTGIVFFSSLAGYAFARIRFPGRNVLFLLILSGLFMPIEVTIIPLFRLFSSLGWIDTHLPLIIAPWFGPFMAFGVFIMRQAFLSLPVELEEAATIDGLGRLGIYYHIGLPLMKPSLAAVAVLGLINSWNKYLEPLVYVPTTEKFTVPIALTQYVTTEGGPVWEVQMAATTLSILPLVIVFLFAQKYFIEGIASTGLKG